ncbi:MAG: VOC family protein [Paracoccaceae bacterium]|nr:MAG: VOC family protein [Paracoccaceae bacterium]
MALVSGYHHLTLSTDGVQEDFDFYTRTLGLYSIKRTVLFDGTIPVYHLYYGSQNGDASTIVTTFPFRKPAIYGRRGTNQTRTIMQTIPAGASDFWVDRLNAAGIPAEKGSRFGLTRVMFAHPCGIPHELVENPADTRPPIVNASRGIGPQVAIRGIYGGAVACFDPSSMDEFLIDGMGLVLEARTDEGLMFSVPDTLGPHSVVEVIEDRVSRQGTWMLAGGTVHHMALNTGTEENQIALKARLEGMGFTDVSEQKDRNYFKSMYVRSPGGALFEIAWTVPEGWAKDEPVGQTGRSLVFPPWFEDRKAELIAGLEPADFG